METGITQAPTATLEAAYTLTAEDFAALYRYLFDQAVDRRDRDGSFFHVRMAFWGLHVILLGLVGLSVWGAMPSGRVALGNNTSWTTLAVFFSVLDLLLWLGVGRHSLVRRWARARYLRKAMLGAAPQLAKKPRCRLSLLPDHFFDVTDNRQFGPGVSRAEHLELRVAWSVVRKIEVVGPRAFFFFLPDYHAIILPQGAFPDEETFRDFVDAAKAYQGGALTDLAPSPALNAAPEERLCTSRLP
jgi:hypothetical protein